VVPGAPKSLDALVMKALARKREERYQSAGEMQLAIEDFLLAERLPGTQAHLNAFMKELYASELDEDRVASEPTVIQFDPRLIREREPSSPSSTKMAPVPQEQSQGKTKQGKASAGSSAGTPARARPVQAAPATPRRPGGSRGNGEDPQ
jgi:serine/threonine-protein kinase